MTNWVYEKATQCTDGPQPGARELLSWGLGAFPTSKNLGIYNCRPIRGTNNTTSLHGEGRAVDFGFQIGDPAGNVLAQWFVDTAAETGVQCVIYERKIWSSAYPNDGWRDYRGSNPHTDHIHVELTWDAARNLTVEKLNSIAQKTVVNISDVASRVPDIDSKPRVLRRGDRGDDVKSAQNRLYKHRFLDADGVDGIFGPNTEGAVKNFQRSRGIEVDGLIGPVTRAKLSETVKPRADIEYLQRAVRITADGKWGPNTDRALKAVLFNTGPTKYRQVRVGTKVDGYWGPNSEAARKLTIRKIQDALGGLEDDGVVGPKTKARFEEVRREFYLKY